MIIYMFLQGLAEHEKLADRVKITQKGSVSVNNLTRYSQFMPLTFNTLNTFIYLFIYVLSDLEQDGFSKNLFFHSIIAEVPEYHKTKEGEFNTVYFTVNPDILCKCVSNRVVGSTNIFFFP